MTNKREQIIQAASALFERYGYHATGLAQILESSQAPKGSLYYYFPGGKEQLAEEAVMYAAQRLGDQVRHALAQQTDLVAAFSQLLEGIENQIVTSGFKAGGPLTAISMETATSNEPLNLACRKGFEFIQAPITEKLRDGGFPEGEIDPFAAFIVAAIEGGTLLSRTQHSREPFQNVTKQILRLLRSML